MGTLKKRLGSNKGFTLVELMIVLSIIAVLATVLVPKVGEMKNAVKNQGVVANISSVRAFLELQSSKRDATTALETTRLIGLAEAQFVGGNAIVNPFTNGKNIGEWSAAVNNSEYSVAFMSWNTLFNANTFETNGNYTGTYTYRQGRVIVWVLQNAYVVWGHDADGKSIQYQVVR